MNRLYHILAAASVIAAAASCQKAAPDGSAGSHDSVSLTIEIPDRVGTKAVSEADNIDIIYYEIWTEGWGKQLYPAEGSSAAITEITRGADGMKTATLEVSLIADQTYEFIFWAQNRDCGAYTLMHLDKIKIDYGVIAADGNQDKYDAFYATHTLKMDGTLTAEESTVILKRPFAQLNFGASEMSTDVGDVRLEGRCITVSGLSTAFDTIAGEGTGDIVKEVEFKSDSDAPMSEKLVITDAAGNEEEYTWITMDYMLMPGTETTVTVDAEFYLDGFGTPVSYTIGSVPLKKNHRTNIVGDLFTEDVDLKIVIDHRFQKPDTDLDQNGNPLTGGGTTVNP